MGFRGDRGQSTVEFALVLPLVALLLLGLLQAGLFLRDLLVVEAVAREAAREAAVSSDRSRIERAAHRAAGGLDISLDIDRGDDRGEPVTVVVTARPTSIPLVGAVVSGQTLRSRAVMRVERATGQR